MSEQLLPQFEGLMKNMIIKDQLDFLHRRIKQEKLKKTRNLKKEVVWAEKRHQAAKDVIHSLTSGKDVERYNNYFYCT